MDVEINSLRNCDICKHDDIDQIEREFLGEQISGKEAGAKLGCSLYVFKNHIEKHLKRDVALSLSQNAPELSKRIFDKTNEIIESCDRTLEMIAEVRAQWRQNKKPEWIAAAVKLEQHLSTNVERLQKINGEFRESGTLRIENLNMQVNNMTQELIEGMCPNCKKKLAPKLLEQIT
jgi:hypothetical protein